MFKRAAITFFLFAGILGAMPGCSKGCKQTEETPTPSAPTAPNAEAPASTESPAPQGAPDAAATPAAGSYDLTPDAQGLSKAVVVMKTTKGTIKFKLYPKDAPNTVKRFAELAHSKFYNGLTFHRVVPGFVVQTGDPKSRNKNDTTVGTGGSGQKLKAEFNGRRHVRGTVAMARAADPDSADSQFYISLGTFPHLDNNYTVFGTVTDFGEKVGDKDVLDRIRQGDEIVEMHLE